jgi:hypothetical protein
MYRLVVRSVASALLVSAVVLGGWGCGGGASDAKDQAPDPASLAPAPDLSIFVKVEAASSEAQPYVANVTSALTTSLTSAGYKLVASEEGKPDVFANVKVTATEEKSVFQVQVNGQVQTSYKVSLSASFVSAGESSVIDQASSEFSAKDGNVDQKAIDKILVHLGTTGKLNAYAASSKAKVQAAEDDLWKAANVEGCKKPASAKACDGVKDYIAKYPSGKYTAEARQAIQDSEAEMARVKEEDAWKAAVVDQCKKPTKSYDCKAVEEYLKAYPTGAHAAEAKDAMKGSEKTREALKKKEEAEKKKASRDECIKDCRRSYETYAAFEILVARCVQTECS